MTAIISGRTMSQAGVSLRLLRRGTVALSTSKSCKEGPALRQHFSVSSQNVFGPEPLAFALRSAGLIGPSNEFSEFSHLSFCSQRSQSLH